MTSMNYILHILPLFCFLIIKLLPQIGGNAYYSNMTDYI